MSEEFRKGPVKVLIVEDDGDFAFLIRKLLRKQEDILVAGYCAEPEKVMRMVLETEPDVVLMDLNYAFDPFAQVKRLFQHRRDMTLLVDEAHHAVDAAGRFACCVQTGNRIALDVENLGFFVDFKTAHGVVNSRNLLAGVPRTFCHWSVICVCSNKSELVFSAFV